MSRIPRVPLTPLLFAASAIAIGYLLFTTTHYVVHDYQLRRDERDVRADIARLDRERAQLIAVRDYLKSDEYIEAIARRILGLVRPGETLVVVSSADGATAAPTPRPQRTPGEAWWRELFSEAPAATPSP